MPMTSKQNSGYLVLASGKEGNSFAPTSAPQSVESQKTGIGRQILLGGPQSRSWIIVRFQANVVVEIAIDQSIAKTRETPAALPGLSFISG